MMIWSRSAVAANGLQIAEVRDYGEQIFNLQQNYERRTKHQ